MTKHLKRYRTLGVAGVLALAVAGVSAAPAAAVVACPPGTSSGPYCTNVPVTTSGHSTTVTVPPGSSLVVPVSVGGVAGGSITVTAAGGVAISIPPKVPPGTYTYHVKIGGKTITITVTIPKPKKPKKK